MTDWLAGLGEAAAAGLQAIQAALGASGVGLLVMLALASVLLLAIAMVWRWRRGRQRWQHLQQVERSLLVASEQLQSQQRGLEEKTQQLYASQAEIEQLRPLEAALAASQAEVTVLGTQLQRSQLQAQSAESELKQLSISSHAKESELNAKQQAMQEKLELLQSNKEQLTLEFQNLANRIFEDKNRKFSESSKQLLDHTLSPLSNQLDAFRKKVEQTYDHESKERHLLKGEIEKLRAESLRISEDATNLTQALKADNKSQGNWGEFSLKKALESCGLREGVEFETQVSYSAEGGRAIPDVVIHLPDGRDIIVDSKVSLLAYTRYFEAEDNAEQQQYLREHLQSVRKHVKDLGAKDYSSIADIQTLDYVMLYIPIEGASSLALQHDLELMNFAYDKKIILVGPNNLLAILKTVETLWRRDRQSKHAEQIAAEAGKLHDQFVLFAQSLEDIGRQLARASDAYDKATERLSTGRGNLLRRVDLLRKLGAKTNRELPTGLRDKARLDSDGGDDSDDSGDSDDRQKRIESVVEVSADDAAPAALELVVEDSTEGDNP